MSHSARKQRIRTKLRSIHGSACHWCTRRMVFEPAFSNHPMFATVEHLVPRAAGGTNHFDNLRLACKRCNNERGMGEHTTPEQRASQQRHAEWQNDIWRQRQARAKAAGITYSTERNS